MCLVFEPILLRKTPMKHWIVRSDAMTSYSFPGVSRQDKQLIENQESSPSKFISTITNSIMYLSNLSGNQTFITMCKTSGSLGATVMILCLIQGTILSLHNCRDPQSLQPNPGSRSALVLSTLDRGKAEGISIRSERDKTWITVVGGTVDEKVKSEVYNDFW